MSGQAGGQGYLIQAMIAVLDALNERDWTECVLEPNLGEDKIDLLLRSSGGDRVSQIKSSENPIGAAQVRAWAESLEAAYPGAERYQLRLIGPVTSGAASASRVGNVEIPVPEALNIRALLEQCAHALGALGDLALHEGDKAGAISLLEEQMSLTSSPQDNARVGVKLAEVLAAEGNRERASALLRQALESYVSANHEVVDPLLMRIRVIEGAEVRS